MFTKFRNNFITGVAIIFPVAITIIIVRYLVVKINSLMLSPLANSLKDNPYLTRHSIIIAKLLIFIFSIMLIAIVGRAARVIFFRRIFGFGEKIFVKVPMIGKIYSVTKEIGSAFLGQGKAFFQKVVVIEYPRKGIYSIGFLTGEEKGRIKDAVGKDLISVFLPTTPNPTSGYFLLLPKEDAKILDMSVEEGMKIVVSSGAVRPQLIKR